jgi:hypothetical protein
MIIQISMALGAVYGVVRALRKLSAIKKSEVLQEPPERSQAEEKAAIRWNLDE